MKEPIALEILKKYFKKHGYNTKRLNPDNFDTGVKIPDFEIYKNKKIKFICELKSPNLILDKQTKLFKWTTTTSKLRKHIHKAVLQFDNYDPDHSIPRVLIFISDNMQLNWKSLENAINGKIEFNNKTIKDLKNLDFIQRTKLDTTRIDLIIWFQVDSKSKTIFQHIPFINIQSILIEKIEEILIKMKLIKNNNIIDKNLNKYT